MSQLIHSLTRPLTSQAFDVKAAQLATWLASILVLVLGMLKLCQLPLNEKELLFGVLLVMSVSLLGVLIGLVLPIASRETTGEHSIR